uniref:basic immunoglobulin-like variable motif-containing protein isoform X1 n=1 Tax=Styela clava TaxID=7725 RepID=UPI00193A8C0D|nr:basic immunoglobulin-like variable motif-containing protein isoform X1 [Styela clava]
MGSLLSILRPKIGDALPDINRTNHTPVDESDSEYESCFEDDANHNTIVSKSQHSLGQSSTFISESLKSVKPKTPTKYHYNDMSKKKNGFLLPEQTHSVIEGSVMEETSVSSSSEESDSEPLTLGVKGKIFVKSARNLKSLQTLDSTVVTSQPCTTDNFSTILSNPAGGDPCLSSTAWEIDVGSDLKKSAQKSSKTKFRRSARESQEKSQGPDLSGLTNEILAERKVLDLRRWHCISRPQYKKSCGLSSVVSVWNYLYSNLGTGTLPPITQEAALHCLGFKPPFEEIRFGPFTGNATLMRWFRRLNERYGVHGRAFYLYKPKGRLQTRTMTDESAITQLKNGLVDEKMGFIYHCLNHYFCPIGYEDTPLNPTEAYLPTHAFTSILERDSTESLTCTIPCTTWFFIGEPSRCHPPIHCKKWCDILQDLHSESPYYFDIRQTHRGVQERKTKKKGRNLHCIIAFKKIESLKTAKYKKIGS